MPVRDDATGGLRPRVHNDRYVAAARRLFSGRVTFDQNPPVQRPAHGGAFVECHVWVPEAEAEKESER